MSAGEQRAGVELTNLDQPLSPDALATKRDLVDYLDAVADRMLPGLVGRPLTVLRVLRGQAPFMQKNAPKYTPDWVKTVPIWAEASKREVRYPLCDDRRTLLWLANQRAVEYHPSLWALPTTSTGPHTWCSTWTHPPTTISTPWWPSPSWCVRLWRTAA